MWRLVKVLDALRHFFRTRYCLREDVSCIPPPQELNQWLPIVPYHRKTKQYIGSVSLLDLHVSNIRELMESEFSM